VVALMEKLTPICVGVDVGQIHDPTALAVAEVIQIHTGKYRAITPIPLRLDTKSGQWIPPKDAEPVMTSEYTLRHIQRLPLGTSYPDVAIHIADMLCKPLFAKRDVRVLIDVTGVGRPVYDDLQREIERRREVRHVVLKPISFSHGEKYNRSTGVLGKAYLVSRLQSLLQGGRVHAPNTSEVKAMLEELRVYEIKVDQDGKDTYGAITGKHDDLATALGLACLEDPFGEVVRYSKRVY
jgi:hypothetical protein